MDRRRLTHQEAADDLPAFVLGVLDGDEAAAIAAHLVTCATCQTERDRLEETIGYVGMTAHTVTPPAELRDRFLGQLADTEPERAPEPVAMIPQRSLVTRLSRYGFAAAAVLLAGVLVWGVLMRQDLQSTQDSLNLANQRQANEAELLANAVQSVPMVADSSPGAYGTLYLGAQKNQALLVLDELPPSPAGKMYQVWLNSSSSRVSAGLFTVDHSGQAMVMISAPDPLSNYQSLGITSEPAPNGSPSPTGERIIGCSLH